MRRSARSPSPLPSSPALSQSLDLRFLPGVGRFVSGAISPTAPEEWAAFGTRGDGKTIGACGVMIAHAQQHQAAGGTLPTKWLGAADTFTSHKAKTLDSLTSTLWRGLWSLKDDGHQALFAVNGQTLVDLRLFGVEDQAGMDRLRAECHGLWFEEPAPSSVLVQSTGLSEHAWGLGITSCRLPSYKHPKIMTLNYPDEDHWTAQRFVFNPLPGTAYVRIPPGERASAEDRAEWSRALANRPDVMRRLLEGQFGTIMLGAQVARGFDQDAHTTRTWMDVERGPALWLGQDAGLTPTTVIGQRVGQEIRILAGLASEHDGMKQHIRGTVMPWIGEHAPWLLDGGDPARVQVRYDPSMDTDDPGDINSNPLRVMRALLPGVYVPGPVSWPGRKDPMLALFNSRNPTLVISAMACKGLIRALTGGWHYKTTVIGDIRKEEPEKNHPHSDYGDAFAYLVAGVAPFSTPRTGARERPTIGFNPFTYDTARPKSKTGFELWPR